jgi:hypothetical protein
VGGRALLAEPVKPSFFRAPTDNDLGGSNNISFAVRCAGPARASAARGPSFRRPCAYWAGGCSLPCTAMHLLVLFFKQRAPRLSVRRWLLAVLAQYEAHSPKVRRKPGRIWERAPERLRRGAGRAWAGAGLAAYFCDCQDYKKPCNARRWKEAGLDCLDVEPGTCQVAAAAQRGGAVRVEASWRLAPRFEAALEVAEFADAGVSEARRPARRRAPASAAGCASRAWALCIHPGASCVGLYVCITERWYIACRCEWAGWRARRAAWRGQAQRKMRSPAAGGRRALAVGEAGRGAAAAGAAVGAGDAGRQAVRERHLARDAAAQRADRGAASPSAEQHIDQHARLLTPANGAAALLRQLSVLKMENLHSRGVPDALPHGRPCGWRVCPEAAQLAV